MTDTPRQTNLSGAPIEDQLQHPPESMVSTAVGVMGNVLEWYDFALFGFLSDVISQVFFPPEDAAEEAGNANLLKSFVIFGSAFLMRPFGGLMIGYIGDKHGRKAALTQSLFMMALPTTLMGCLPTYQQVGVFSTILLCLCRLIQGISVGGQLPASLVYTVEKRPKQHWGYYGSLPMVAANVGTLLGNLCGALMRQVLTEEQLLSWGGGCHSFRASSLPLWLATCGGRVTMCIPIGECTIGKIPKSPIQSAWQSEKEIDWRC